MINHWHKPVVTLRDIAAFGPNCARDPADIMNLTKTLVQYGWLIPATGVAAGHEEVSGLFASQTKKYRSRACAQTMQP